MLLAPALIYCSPPSCCDSRARRFAEHFSIVYPIHILTSSCTSLAYLSGGMLTLLRTCRKHSRVTGISLCLRPRFGQLLSAKFVRPQYRFVTENNIPQANTALQLLLMGITTINPVLAFDLGLPLPWLGFVAPLEGLQFVTFTTIRVSSSLP